MVGVPVLLVYLLIGLLIYCLVDIVTSDRAQVGNLPKWAWLLLAIALPPVGVVLWFTIGRPPRPYGGGERWPVGGTEPRARVHRRPRPAASERLDDDATIRARIAERDALLARWAEEDRQRQEGDR
jgi:hypothetical protein